MNMGENTVKSGFTFFTQKRKSGYGQISWKKMGAARERERDIIEDNELLIWRNQVSEDCD